jgi:hypothetical protein
MAAAEAMSYTFHDLGSVEIWAGTIGTPDRVHPARSALGIDRTAITPDFAAHAIERTAMDLAISPAALDHSALRWQRGR